ncbi:universal stress protein [Conexibacter sp. CPCC 206217]|uniref:universal stress protein n=1 Tax=Conexibacter sp. CPCC 206217 TaxID=3064574 RepID=UPI00272180E1|nr:universal stress protein [Conexibacter sp. CPCC 206217]MDO8214199.1 universal stress protein [Conexibacter sp. CPCC 206217]
MRKILIGYDGSSHGDDALALGRVLAEAATDPQVVVATVYDALIPKNTQGEPSLREERLRDEAQQTLLQARAAWPELNEAAFQALRATSPSAGLHRAAADDDFDVIVLGSSHRHGLGRIWAGSVTEQTLAGAPRAVAVAPPGYAAKTAETTRLRRVGVAYDGSVEAVHALDLAAELVDGGDATVVAIDVVDTVGPPLTGGYGYGSFVGDMRDLADRNLAAARVALEQHGIERVELERPEGGPARDLIAASERLDLLLLGSRSHGPALRLLLGSVSARVVREAACPVLLHPRSADPR